MGPYNEQKKTEEAPSDDQVPSWPMKLCKSHGSPPPPAPVGERPVKKVRENRDEDHLMAATRNQKPNGRIAFDVQFRFNGCWHCIVAKRDIAGKRILPRRFWVVRNVRL